MGRTREIVAVVLFVLGSIKAFYEFRSVPWVGASLSVTAAVLLIYPAYWHAEARGLGIHFVEGSRAEVAKSLRLFLILALAVFPLFLVANHFYQGLVYEARFSPRNLNIGWVTVLTQVFLVALPEEFFYRGYVQTLIARRVGRSFRFLGIPGLTMSWAVPLTAFFFAFSHSFITFRWWHFAIFFPALAFGWLREKTNGLIAPVLFHALSNLIVNSIGTLYR